MFKVIDKEKNHVIVKMDTMHYEYFKNEIEEQNNISPDLQFIDYDNLSEQEKKEYKKAKNYGKSKLINI